MPHQTFFNLPAEKREQILTIAVDEFAGNDYESASISRIVARAGIAKGSFYQYFTDKEDLYAYLLGLLAQAKAEFFSLDHPDPQHVGIFAYLRWMAEAGVAFELAQPKLSRIGLRAAAAGRYPKAFDDQVREATLAFYSRLVEVGQRQGDIAADVDPLLAAFMFETLMASLGRYLFEQVVDPASLIQRDRQALFDLPDVRAALARTIAILEHGLRGA
jgi:AcrR family transcriptional regulator